MAVEPHVVEAVAAGADPVQPGDRHAEGADGVPDTHEVDHARGPEDVRAAKLGGARRPAERLPVAGGPFVAGFPCAHAIDRHALAHRVRRRAAGEGAAPLVGNGAEADQPRQAARGVGAAAVAEQEQPVARQVVRGQPLVGELDVPGQPEPEHASPEAVETPGADAAVVVGELLHALRGHPPDGLPGLDDVRRRRGIVAVPGAVEAERDVAGDAYGHGELDAWRLARGSGEANVKFA